MSTPQYALRFISGKYQGGVFPLRSEREVVIGRGSDVDMVLVEDMVSRRHARIVADNGGMMIHDLGSTNGTFVNGEKVREARLKEGDRILIGTSILRLIAADGDQPMVTEADARRGLEATSAKRAANTSMRMSGAIDEIPLPDLMQLLSTSKKSGVLFVQSPGNGDGRIYFRKGQIYFARLDGVPELRAKKSIWRMLAWETGSFSLEPPDEGTTSEELEDSTEGLLMEGMRQLDELHRLEAEGQAPSRKAELRLASPLEAPLRELEPLELDTLQAVLNYGEVQAVLDRCRASDLDTLQALKRLVAFEYLVHKQR